MDKNVGRPETFDINAKKRRRSEHPKAERQEEKRIEKRDDFYRAYFNFHITTATLKRMNKDEKKTKKTEPNHNKKNRICATRRIG